MMIDIVERLAFVSLSLSLHMMAVFYMVKEMDFFGWKKYNVRLSIGWNILKVPEVCDEGVKE